MLNNQPGNNQPAASGRIPSSPVKLTFRQAMIITAAFGMGIFYLLVFIVPKIAGQTHDMFGNRPLPLLTALVFGASYFLKSQFYYFVLLLILLAIIWPFFTRSITGRALLRDGDNKPRRFIPAAPLVISFLAVIALIAIGLYTQVFTNYKSLELIELYNEP